MTNLDPATILERIPNVKMELDSSNEVQLLVGNQTIQCGPHALTVLNLFSQPTSLAEALAKVKSTGVQDRIDLTNTIMQLYKEGVLRDKARTKPMPDALGFGAVPIHVIMLNNRERTEKFLNAIREVVRPGDVVIDIGTGSGILAIAAARAGAAHVYAIEVSAMANVARQIIKSSDVADRITLIRGWVLGPYSCLRLMRPGISTSAKSIYFLPQSAN